MWITITSKNRFEPSIRVLANFYETEQVDEFQGKESKVDAIIDRDENSSDLNLISSCSTGQKSCFWGGGGGGGGGGGESSIDSSSSSA